jgi:hypothetical protein
MMLYYLTSLMAEDSWGGFEVLVQISFKSFEGFTVKGFRSTLSSMYQNTSVCTAFVIETVEHLTVLACSCSIRLILILIQSAFLDRTGLSMTL